MNSRDAAFDESLKEIMEQTAAEAAAGHDKADPTASGSAASEPGKKKRKRVDDEGYVSGASC